MALDGSKTLKISNIALYTGPVGTKKPDDLGTIPPTWENMGHTSIQDLLSIETEGGETTTLGSAQSAALRQDTTDAVRSFVMNLLQWEDKTLQLFFGKNATSDGNFFQPAEKPQPAEYAVLIVIEDGDFEFGIHAAKASFIGQGNLSLTDKNSLSQLPIRITPLSHNNKKPFGIVLPTA